MNKIKKLELNNFLNLIIFFIFIFFLECISFAYFYPTERFADLDWYINSGEKILSGSAEFDNFIYSPLFSLLSVFIKNSADNKLLFLLIQVAKIIYFFITAILFSYLINFSNEKKKIILDNQLLVIAFILFNPFIVKFINPQYSILFFSSRYIFCFKVFIN